MAELADIEKRIFSQNGEDGIIEFLVGTLWRCENRFLEFGCGSGKRNNCTRLAYDGWFGIAVDRKAERINQYKKKLKEAGAEHVQLFNETLYRRSVQRFVDWMPTPDVFSIDIDSVDWHLVKTMLETGRFQPDIMVVEYNASFGQHPVTVPYSDHFRTHWKNVHYGASVTAWDRLLCEFGYEFVTVESSGANAFFIHEDGYEKFPLTAGDWLDWTDNKSVADQTNMTVAERWERLQSMPLETV